MARVMRRPISRSCRDWALLELYHDLRAEHTAWVRRIHAVFFYEGAPALGDGALRTGKYLAAPRAAAAAHLSPVGQLQVAVSLEVLEALEARMHQVRHQLLAAARHLTGARVLAAPVPSRMVTILARPGRQRAEPSRAELTGWGITAASSRQSAVSRSRPCRAGPGGRPE
jgi:transposase